MQLSTEDFVILEMKELPTPPSKNLKYNHLILLEKSARSMESSLITCIFSFLGVKEENTCIKYATIQQSVELVSLLIT